MPPTTPSIAPLAFTASTTPADRPPGRPGLIQVEAVEVGSFPGGPRVRAVVRLGGLSPADVHVELVREEGRPRPAVRMWSSQAYGNGCFVFEAAIPGLPTADQWPGHGWAVRVRPTDDAAVTHGGRPGPVLTVDVPAPRSAPPG